MKDKYVLVYSENIFEYFESAIQYEDHLKSVLQQLREQKWYAKVKINEFGNSKVKYLKYVVGSSKLQLDWEKAQSVKDRPALTSIKELQ